VVVFGDDVALEPRVANMAFACGLAGSPAVSTYPAFYRGYTTFAHLRGILAAKLHLLLRGFEPADWLKYGKKSICTALEPLRLGWPSPWVTSILCGTRYVQNRTCSRLNMSLGLWLRCNKVLVQVARKQQVALGPDYGFNALFEYWCECLSAFSGPTGGSTCNFDTNKKIRRRV
jgi:hypothetical protein